MKLAIIGIGDICKKAYLPVITAISDIELVLCTRNKRALDEAMRQYRIKEGYTSVDDLLGRGIQGAFVHSSTESHPEIIEKLLRGGIHVFVDKPIAYDYATCVRLTERASSLGLHLFTGFNRRFAPHIASIGAPNGRAQLVLQKNRMTLPDDARTFIFDDFIHAIDTARFLMGENDVTLESVDAHVCDGLLYAVSIRLANAHVRAFVSMNRDSGCNEEIVEWTSSGEKIVVTNLSAKTHWSKGVKTEDAFTDWTPTLYKRGFETMIRHWIAVVCGEEEPHVSAASALETHRLAEEIVGAVKKLGGLVDE
ncbi:MAG: Gfo/Idh/MocA family protein [Bacilli bacterium]